MRNLILMVFLVTSLNGSAAVITWTNGNTTNLWSDPLNWSSGTIPGAADVATFNATSVANCNLDVVANVAGFNIQAGYTGIITQNAGITITIGSSNFSQAGGTFTGGNSNIDINSGSFSLSGGSFLSTTATLFVGGTFSANTTLFTHTAGTFTHNNGEVEFDPYRASCTQTTFTVDVLTSTQFYDVEINGSQSCGVSAVLTTAAGDTLDAAHDFIHTNGYLNGMWELKNDLYIGASSDGGLGQIIFNSTVGQQYSVNAAAPRTCTIVIDKTAGAVTPAGGTTDFSMQAFILNQGSFTAPTGTMKIGGTFSANTTLFTHTAGTFTHNNGEVEFDPYRASCTQTTFTVDVLTSTQFYDVEINGSQSCGVSAVLTTAAGDTLDAAHDFIHTNGYLNGMWELKNDLYIGASSDGGLGQIIFNSTVGQQYSVNAAAPRTCTIVIDKTAGAVTPAGGTTDFSMQAFILNQGSFTAPTGTMKIGGTFSANTTLFTHTAGTFTHNNGEVEFDPYRASCTQTTFTVDVLTSTQFYDVEINGSQSCGVSAVLTTAAGDTLDAAHDFIHTNGYLNGMWELKNDLYIGASSDGGLGQIIFNSTVGQQYSVNAAAPRTCTIVIDKTAGAVTPAGGTTDFSMQAFILNQGSFTAPTGTMKIGGTFSANTTLFTHTAGTFTHNNGEVEFDPYRASCTQTTFTVDVLTSTQFYDVEINGSQSCGVSAVLTTAAGDTLDAAHDFIHTNGYLNGMWELKNDLYIGASSDGGLGQIIFNSTVGQQYSVNAAAPRTCTIVIDKTAGAVTPAGGTTDFSMQAFILNQGSFTAPTGTMKIGGTFSANTTLFTHTAGTFTHNNGEVEFDPYRASCTQTTFTVDVLTSTQFYDVEINGSQSCGVSAVLTTAAGDSLHVSNLLTLTNGLFNTTYLEAYGNVTVVSTWDGGSGTLIFAGGNAQSFDLTGATTQFNGDIVIDKTSNSVALLSNLQMDAGTGFDLYLNKGHLITTSTEMLIIGDNVKTFNSSDSSFVQGIMRKIGNDAFTFPVGKNDTAYAPITISAPSLTTDHFTAEYFQVDPNTPGYNTSSKDLSLDHLSQCEYWILDRTNGTSNVSVTLSWDDRSCGVTNLSDLAVARWDGAQWKDHGNGGTTGSTANGTVVSNVAISAFSPFTLASSTSQNPLPIELLYFSANLNSENIVDLYWSTASEINNDYFQIERSADGLNWENISLIDGAGNSSVVSNYSAKDVEPLDGISYYRLKQVDFDGEFSYSNIVSVQLRNNNTVNIYPNPTTDFVFINYGQEVETLEIYNSIGQNVTSTIASITENNGIYSISLKNLAPGAYYVKTSTTANIVYKQ